MNSFKFLNLLLLLTFFTSNYAQKSKETCANAKAKKFTAKSNTLTVNQIAKTEKYDVTFYQLDLGMTNTSTFLSGTVTIEGKARETLDSVLIELFPTFTIAELKLNDNAVAYNRYATILAIPVNLSTNQTFKIAVTYSGTPPDAASNPLGGSGMTNDFSPSWGNQVTWSLSEPFSAYEWFPCKQSLKDKADSVDINITVPSNCKAGSNGKLTAITSPSAGVSTYHWKHRHPIDYYLISVAVAEYVDYSIYANPVGSSPVLIQNYIYNNPETLPNFQADIDETVDFLEFFSETFGLYPFYDEKYGHCMAPLGGGMEHQTMTTQGFFEKTLTAHELAHQWWGDQVTCQSWADIWVNEGFASYAEYLMLDEMYPGEEVQDMQNRHDNIMSQNNGSIYVVDSLNSGRIFSGRLTYDKGAAFVHTLRFMLNNDTQFFQGLRNYQTQFANKTALGIDVQQSLEAVSGLDLSDAFEQWYFGEGFPTYSARWNYVNEALQVIISQTSSASNVTPLFTNPLELKFTRFGLSDTIIRFDINSNNASFLLPISDSITNLTAIDPNNWIINQTGTISKDATLDFSELPEFSLQNELIVFPNPAKDFIQFKGDDFTNYQLNIIDPKGKNICSKTILADEKIDVSAFSSGTYLIQLVSPNQDKKYHKLFKK